MSVGDDGMGAGRAACQKALGGRACRRGTILPAGTSLGCRALSILSCSLLLVFCDLLPVNWTPSQLPPLELVIARMIVLEIIIINTYIVLTLPGTLIDALHIFLPSREKIVKKVNFSCSSLVRKIASQRTEVYRRLLVVERK